MSDANANKRNGGALSIDLRYNGNTRKGYDIGLITLSDNKSIIDPLEFVGLLAFENPDDAKGYTVTTAGYPALVKEDDIDTSNNAQYILRDDDGDALIKVGFGTPIRSEGTAAQVLFVATGTIEDVDSNGILELSSTLDGEVGESGGGYWTTLEGDEPRVLGVVSFENPGVTRVGIDSDIGKGNFAASIDTDAYSRIVEKMKNRLEVNSGNDLPENAIVGSDESDDIKGSYRRERILGNKGQDTISGGDADDRLEGGAGYDILKGEKGDDRLQGDGANDSLDGGEGDNDVAVFSDKFENYEYSELGGSTFGVPEGGLITIEHIDGTYADGKDTLVGIEFGIFGAGEPIPLANSNDGATTNSNTALEEPRIIPLPLEDGVEDTEFVEVTSTAANPNPNDPPTPPYVSLTTPVDMLDGDIEYTVNISPYEADTEYNIVYVIDTSDSIGFEDPNRLRLQTIQNAYTDLTNYYIDQGIAENINFGVVSYDTSGRLHTVDGDQNLNANEALTVLQNLTVNTLSGTRYYDGLDKAEEFLLDSPKNTSETTSIGYFFTDGQNSGDRLDMLLKAKDVRELANFQAIGYFSDLSTLTSDSRKIKDVNWIDSNQGVFIDNLNDLSPELLKSDLADDVVQVNILLDGQVVETLTPEQFTDSPLGLTYSGTAENTGEIEELDVSVDAENIITAEVVFTSESSFATTEVEQTVTAGKGEVVDENGDPIDESSNEDVDPFERMRSGGDGHDDITLGFIDKGANGGAGGDKIVGNRRDNILDGGSGNDTIFGHEGNDTIITGMGINEVDGGEDIDTALYSDVIYEGNSSLSFGQAGNRLIYLDGDNFPHTDYLTNIEYLQFSDVRISAETLEVTPTVEEISDVSVTEGETVSFSFNLDYPAPVDVTFNYTTEDIDATAGEDYTATSGQTTIPAGETTATIDIATTEDTIYDEGTQTFNLNLTGLMGATFSNDETELTLTAFIEDRDEPLTLIGTNEDDFLTGGGANDSLKGNAGNDYLYGEAGNDTLRGDAGDDSLDGGEGDDSLFGNAGNDTIIGGEGYDRIVEIYDGNFVLSDTQLNANGVNSIDGIEMVNMTGGNSNNFINANSVTSIDTIINSQAGNDTIRGGAAKDIINAGADDDVVIAGAGNDNIKGDTGNDSLNGGAGDDTLVGSAGNDTIVGGSGFDLLLESGNSDFILTNNSLVGNGIDSLTAIQQVNITGGNSNNLIDASAVTTINKTFLSGGAGDDTIKGGAKQDTLVGDAGNDLLEGGDLRDILYGSTGNDNLMGMSGNDVL